MGDGDGSNQRSELGDVPSHWHVAPLNAFVSRVTYGFTNPMPATDDGPFMVTAKDVHSGRIDYSSARHTSWDAYKNKITAKSRPRVNDVLLTKDGSIGRVAVCDRSNICINQSVALIQPNEDTDARFLKYLLEAPHYQRRLERDSDGTTIKHIYITRVDKMVVAMPPLPEQRAIAHILGSLDDKIDLNRRMNETLETMARAIFKAWFIDFEPVKAKAHGAAGFRGMPQDVFEQLPDKFVESALGLVPASWQIIATSGIAEYVNGKAFTQHANGEGRMIIRIAELNSGPGGATKYSDIDTEPQYTAFPGDILFAWSGSLGVYRWHRDEAIINQHIFKVIPTDRPNWYVYYRLVEAMPFFQGIASTKATTMGHIKRSHLSDATFVEPPTWLIEAANNLISPLFDLIHINERQSFNLAAMRDLLLPKLISGEIRVHDAEGVDDGQ